MSIEEDYERRKAKASSDVAKADKRLNRAKKIARNPRITDKKRKEAEANIKYETKAKKAANKYGPGFKKGGRVKKSKK